MPYQKVWTDQQSAYEDSHVVHVGQFYFNESFVSDVAKEAPYNTTTAFRTPLMEDNYYYVEVPITEISLMGSKLSEGIVGKAEAIVFPYWDTVKPGECTEGSKGTREGQSLASSVHVNSAIQILEKYMPLESRLLEQLCIRAAQKPKEKPRSLWMGFLLEKFRLIANEYRFLTGHPLSAPPAVPLCSETRAVEQGDSNRVASLDLPSLPCMSAFVVDHLLL